MHLCGLLVVGCGEELIQLMEDAHIIRCRRVVGLHKPESATLCVGVRGHAWVCVRAHARSPFACVGEVCRISADQSSVGCLSQQCCVSTRHGQVLIFLFEGGFASEAELTRPWSLEARTSTPEGRIWG